MSFKYRLYENKSTYTPVLDSYRNVYQKAYLSTMKAESLLHMYFISDEDYQLLCDARKARRQIIDVDYFTAQLEEDTS